MLTREQVLSGKCVFTVEPAAAFCEQHSLRAHFTFRVDKGEKQAGYRYDPFFVKSMFGIDNVTDYCYLGMLNPKDGSVRLTNASRFGECDWQVRIVRRVMARVWAGDITSAMEAVGWRVHASRFCKRCGAVLTVPASVETDYGPICGAYVLLGIEREDIPQTNYPQLAIFQYRYWMEGGEAFLNMLKDACQEFSEWPENKADALVALTRNSMRHFKKGANLSQEFLAIIK